MTSIASYIDHTLLKPNTTLKEIEVLCAEAKNYHFASVCVSPCWVKVAASLLKDSDVAVCTVIGFPHGTNTTATKVFEAVDALKNGARELDMVINNAYVAAGLWREVEEEIKALQQCVSNHKGLLKVIIESSTLSDETIKTLTQLVARCSASFIKTSTGFAQGGASPEAVKLMKQYGTDQLKIKASGGIRSRAQLLEYVSLGASRIGTSSGVAIMESTEGSSSY
jgi:deoxyribose-phosphate aldolase